MRQRVRGTAVVFTLMVTLAHLGNSCGLNVLLGHPDSWKFPGKVNSQPGLI